jgi:hypothetical protein
MTFYLISADSNFGSRYAIYKLIENVLIIRDEGDHDNLAGNNAVVEFGGLTIQQAQQKIEAIMAEPVGHSFDGCHACTWSIRLRKLAETEVPVHLTYNEPNETFAIREALRRFRAGK